MFQARRRRRAEPIVVDVGEGGSLAEGTIVDTAIVARLARVPLLRLEGTVVLTPARALAAPPPLPSLPAPPPTVVGSVEPSPLPPASSNGNGRIGASLPDIARRLERLRGR